VGFARWRRRDPADPLRWICLGSAIATLLWVSTFNGWHGGATIAARYLIVVLPLFVLALRELPGDRTGRRLLLMLGVPSVLIMLCIAAVSPLVSEFAMNPLFGEIWLPFQAGALHPHVLPIRLQRLDPDPAWRAVSAWNWGELAGLSGLTSLLPWIVLVGAGSALVWRSARRP
jgi:hypothetical protein